MTATQTDERKNVFAGQLPENAILTIEEFCHRAQVSLRQVEVWESEGMPIRSRNKVRFISVADWWKWFQRPQKPVRKVKP